MRFSNPSRAAFEKRRLCASAQTRSSRASAAVEIDNDRTARNPAATRRALLPSPLWAGLSHLALVRSPIGILESGLFLLRNFRIQRVAPAHNWNRKFPNAIPLPRRGGRTRAEPEPGGDRRHRVTGAPLRSEGASPHPGRLTPTRPAPPGREGAGSRQMLRPAGDTGSPPPQGETGYRWCASWLTAR